IIPALSYDSLHVLHSFPTRRSSDLHLARAKSQKNSHPSACARMLNKAAPAIRTLAHGHPPAPLHQSVESYRGFLAEYLSSQFPRSEEHTSELQSRFDLVCRLLLEKK